MLGSLLVVSYEQSASECQMVGKVLSSDIVGDIGSYIKRGK